MNKNIGIYKITNPNNRIYIGQSCNLLQRQNTYKSGCSKNQRKLYNSIKKYGWDSHIFEILEYCEFNELNNRERYWQEYYDCINKNNLNCVLTKTNKKKLKVSDETRKKQSLNSKDKIDGEKKSSF